MLAPMKVGLRTGAERMTRYVKRFGFGQLIAPDLPGGSRGLWNARTSRKADWRRCRWDIR